MVARALVVLILIAACTSGQATNRSYWDLWALDVGLICFMQNPTYRSTPLGKMIAGGYGFKGWDAFDRMPSAACLRSRQWVSAGLCDDVTRLDEKMFRNLDDLGRKHQAELRGLKDIIVFRNKSLERNAGALPCPDAK